MSHFTCEKCGENIYDSEFGYVSGCEHYPIVDFLRNCI